MAGGYGNPIYERSFTSIEQMIESQTECGNMSKYSGGTTRRSRKDRSKNKAASRNAITPHALCDPTAQNSLIIMAEESTTSPNVRLMPGGDAISLELNIKGMNEPNKNFKHQP